jgi:uncharacterized repeat protein (TIGR03803 family)
MHSTSGSFQCKLLAFAFTIFLLGLSAFGQTESVLYNFTGGSDGSGPTGNLIFDSAGNLYGTTDAGGVDNGRGGNGVVFELSPATGGGWTETVLYAFQGGTSDGEVPEGGVVFDTAGNLYGTTDFGGAHNLGTVYELSPAAGGGWTEQIIYSFAGGTDGGGPNGGLVFDTAGNLYGTTYDGGSENLGTVFELSPVAGGGWTKSVILNGTSAGGSNFEENVTLYSGSLYATAALGGSANVGSIYRLISTSSGWRGGVIYTFLGGTDGVQPRAPAAVRGGQLFGTTDSGGTYGYGTLYELIHGTGGWSKTIVHDFGITTKDALYPTNPLTIGPAGQLYGTSGSGGSAGNGTAFEFVNSGGAWRERILHNFTGSTTDSGGPAGGVVLDGAGNLYGMGHNGGSFNAGAVFEIVP